MAIISLIPGILCFYYIFTEGTPYAFRYVFLPTLLLLPTYFFYTVRPIPPINFVDACLLALGTGMLLMDVSRWKVTRTDFWMAIFLFTTWYADRVLDRTTDSWLSLFEQLLTTLVPYMAGKLLIEQTGNRMGVVKNFVLLISIPAFLSPYEYLRKSNPYTYFWSRFFPGQWPIWRTQIRWGFGRVAGPFSQSELAGMMCFTAFVFALWIGRKNWEEKAAQAGPSPYLERGKLHIIMCFLALLIAQARGPWIGALLAVPVAAIGNAKRPVRRFFIVATCIFLIGAPTYVLGKKYLAGKEDESGTEKQTAQYRQDLIGHYVPVALKGGLWGWSSTFPRIAGQGSIDNDYLLVWLVQGSVGLAAFVLMICETFLTLTIKGFKAQTVRERHFVFTMLGAFFGLSFTLATVFLGSQTNEVFFLLIGWSQAIARPKDLISPVENDELYRMTGAPEMAGVYS